MANKFALGVAAIMLSVLPISALAATTTTTATTKPMAAATAPALTAKSTFAEVMASLAVPGKTDLSKVTATSKTTIIKVSTLKGYSAAAMKLSPAATKNMTALDESVAANVALTAALKKSSYLPSDVAAVAVDAKGAAVVFVAK